jgi:hypothetical protein
MTTLSPSYPYYSPGANMTLTKQRSNLTYYKGVSQTLDSSGASQMTDNQPSGDTFLFNDFFSDPKDAGLEITVQHADKDIPFRIKHSLNLKERQKAQDAAIKYSFDSKGKPVVSDMNQAAFTAGITLAALIWWPFTYPDGKPVPINKDTVDALDAAISDQIAAQVLKVGQAQVAALDPFALKSDEAS